MFSPLHPYCRLQTYCARNTPTSRERGSFLSAIGNALLWPLLHYRFVMLGIWLAMFGGWLISHVLPAELPRTETYETSLTMVSQSANREPMIMPSDCVFAIALAEQNAEPNTGTLKMAEIREELERK